MPKNTYTMQAVERNPYIGAFADLMAATFSPERTQQAQGIARFMGAPAIASTLDKMSYGDALTTGSGQTLQLKPDVAEAALAVAPFVQPAARLGGRALQAGARELAPQAARMAENYMTRTGMQLNAVPPTNALVNKVAAPQEEALRLAQQRAALPVSQGGLGLPAGNTAQQRAQAMGFDVNKPLYHATDAATDFDAFMVSPKGKLGAGVYTSPVAKYTEKYAGEDARIMPLVGRGKFTTEDERIAVFDAIRQQLVDQNPNFSMQELKDKLLQELKRQGFSGSDMDKERVVFDPENLRSRFAAFDPFRKTAATAAALGVAAPNLLAAENKNDINQLRRVPANRP